jgi:hypothetical protein
VSFGKGVEANSGKITVSGQNNSNFNIRTTGNGAVGIVAQSIAGNGGALFTDGKLSDVTVNAGASQAGGVSGGLDFFLDASAIATYGDYAPGAFLQSGNALYTVFATDGQQTHSQVSGFGLDSSDLQVKNRFLMYPESHITTTGTESHGLVMDTHSYVGSGNAPSMDSNDRSLNIWVNGNINVSGTDSWGVKASNTWQIGDSTPLPTPDGSTTAFTLGEQGTIKTEGVSAGAIQLQDTGNVLANIYGNLNADTATAVDISAANTRLTIGSPNNDPGQGKFQYVYGDVKVTATAGGTNSITLNPGTILYGSITSDTSIGANNAIAVIGTVKREGQEAISLGVLGWNSTITVNHVEGNITASFNSSGNTASLTNNFEIDGSVIGPFDYHMAAASFHNLNIDAANNSSDMIHVNSFSRDASPSNGSVANLALSLTSLPTPEFKSVKIFDVVQGQSLSLSDFNINNDRNVIDYSYSTSLQGSQFVVEVTDIQINLNQSALQGTAAKIAPLAQKHVDAIASGAITANPQSSIYSTLLTAANSAEGSDGKYANLAEYLNNLTGTALDPDTQSTTVAQRNATDSLHSCGGNLGAAVNPIEQGECAWGSVTTANVELGNADHDENTTTLAAGWQRAWGEKTYLGFSLAYDDVDMLRNSGSADGSRLHAGAIYKRIDGNFFASTSLLGSYSAIDSTRRYSDTFDPAITHSATSERDAVSLSSRLRAGYRFSQGRIDLTPMLDLDLFLNRQLQYEEKGSGGLETYASSTTNFLSDAHPRIQLGSHFSFGEANVRVYGEIGQRFALNDPDLDVGLAAGLAGQSTISIVQEREDRLDSWGAGLIADLNDRFELRVNYELTEGDLEKNERFGLKAAYKF